MSAERLREAAKVLRARAGAATPGPWDTHMHSPDMSGRHGIAVRGPRSLGPGGHVIDSRMTSDNAAYIAAMSPPVALAMADVLDVLA